MASVVILTSSILWSSIAVADDRALALTKCQQAFNGLQRLHFLAETTQEFTPDLFKYGKQIKKIEYYRDGSRYDVKYAWQRDTGTVWSQRVVVDNVAYSHQFAGLDDPSVMVFLSHDLVDAHDLAAKIIGPWAVLLDGKLDGDRSLCDLLSVAGDLSVEAEDISGVPTYRLSGTTSYGTVRLWLHAKRDLPPLKLEIHPSTHEKVYSDYSYSVKVESFAEIEGLSVPATLEVAQHYKLASSGEAFAATTGIACSSISTKSDFEADGAFRIAFREGTIITDRDLPIRYRWRNGQAVREVDDKAVRRVDEAVASVVAQRSQGVGKGKTTRPSSPSRESPAAQPQRPPHSWGWVAGVTGAVTLLVLAGLALRLGKRK